MNIDDEKQSDLTHVPSMPIIPATKPILVKHTGPVDEDCYPVYLNNECFKSRLNQSIAKELQQNETDNTEKRLDFLNNKDALIIDPEDDESSGDKYYGSAYGMGVFRRRKIQIEDLNKHITVRAKDETLPQPTQLLKPGTRSYTEDQPLRFYGVHDTARPYHLDGPEKDMVWLSGTTVSAVEAEQEEANNDDIPPFPQHLNQEEARKLSVGDKIDYRGDNGFYYLVTVDRIEGSCLYLELSVGDEPNVDDRIIRICSTRRIYQCDFMIKNQLEQMFHSEAISNRPAHRMAHLEVGDNVTFFPKPEHRAEIRGCTRGVFGRIMKKQGGQIQIRYHQNTNHYRGSTALYWIHLDNENEVIPWPAVEHDPLIRAHGDSYIQCGDIVDYRINKAGIAGNKKWKESDHRVGQHSIEKSRGFVMEVDSRHPLQLKVWNCSNLSCWDGYATVSDKFHHIRRIAEPKPSPLRSLFYIKKTPESALMAWTLKNILGDEHDWLTVNIIAEYLPLSHQRDVYFDTSRFEQVIKIQDNPHLRNDETLCELATALKVDNRMENFHVSKVEQHPAFDKGFAESMVKWQDVHGIKDGWTGFYQRMIFDVARKGHPTFPQDPDVNDKKSTPRHQMYAEKPYLPLINEEGRSNLELVEKRIDIALKPTTKLYGYQLHTVLWCHELERSILAKQSLCVGSNDLRFCFDGSSNCPVYCVEDEKAANIKVKDTNAVVRKKRKEEERKDPSRGRWMRHSEVPEMVQKPEDDEHHEYTYIPADTPRVISPRIITYKGGIVADDVGLGKTLTMLSLMAAHPLGDDVIRNSFHPQTGKLRFGADEETILCAATLVVAPSHLIEQWNGEIDRHFKEELLNVVMITTGADHKKLTYRDILDAQVVLVSKSFLSGTHYNALNRNLIDEHWESLDPSLPPKPVDVPSSRPKRRSSRRSSRSKPVKQEKYQDLSMKSPFLDLFHWRRIVVDEGHELLPDNKLRSNLLRISSEFRWYCTATPFPTDLSVERAAEYLDIRLNGNIIEWSKELNRPFGSVLHNALYHHLYSRHTKESIMTENHLPDVEELCVMIDLHPVERMLYDVTEMQRKRASTDFKLERKICSGILTEFERGLYLTWKIKKQRAEHFQFFKQFETSNVNSNHNKREDDVKEHEETKEPMNDYKRKHEKEREEKEKMDKYPWDDEDEDPENPEFFDNYLQKLLLINRHYFSEIINKLHARIGSLRKELGELRRDKAAGLRYVTDPTDRYRPNDQRPIGKVIKDKTSLLRQSNKQLTSYQPLHDRVHREGVSMEILHHEKEIRMARNGQELLKIMRKFGSKQALLLRFVLETLEDPNNRIIIFSLFGRLLKILKDRLKMVGVEAGLCRGNVHSRKKAMRAFQGDMDVEGNRVILLSSKDAASGADLKLATHVILVDPVPGSASESFAAERQAIGRAVRQGMDERGTATKVLRLVVRNTIEQQTHDRNARIREQANNDEEKVKVERENMRWKLTHSLKMEDREDHEIDFYLNMQNPINSLQTKPSIIGKDNKEVVAKNKRKRSDKEEMDASDDDEEESDVNESPRKKMKLSSRR